MKTPSIPPSFWTALATAAILVGAALGLPVSAAHSTALFQLAAILPTVIVICGTLLHVVRAAFSVNVLHAKSVQAAADAAYYDAQAAVKAAGALSPTQRSLLKRAALFLVGLFKREVLVPATADIPVAPSPTAEPVAEPTAEPTERVIDRS